MSSIRVNDVFEELFEENKRLLNELMFANKCLKVLFDFKTFVDFICDKFRDNLNSNELKMFEKLRKDIKEVLSQRNKVYNESVIKMESNEGDSEDVVTDMSEDNNKVEIRNQLYKSVKKYYGKQNLRIRDKSTQTIDSNKENTSVVKCKHCLQWFDSSDDHKRHLEVHSKSNVKTYQCYIGCGRSYASESDLILHSQQSHPRQTVRFKTVYRNKDQSNDYQILEVENSTKNLFKDYLKTNLSNLLNKSSETVVDDNRINRSEQSSDDHFSDAIDENDCVDCGSDSETTNKPIPHLESVKRFVCEYNGCDYRTDFLVQLKHHRIGHNGHNGHKGFKLLNCGHCSKTFATKGGLENHIKSNDNESEEPLICGIDDCNKVFDNECRLSFHRKIKHLGEKRFFCDFLNCNFSYHYKNELTKHQRYHSMDRQFICEIEGCGRPFKTNQTLRAHTALLHNSAQYKCTFEGCDYECRTKYNFNEHSLKHRNSQPFVCDICSKQFISEKYLSNHKRRVHQKYKRKGCPQHYICDFKDCGKEFFSSIRYNKHKKIHQSIVHKCQIQGCGYECRSSYTLKVHLLQHKIVEDPNAEEVVNIPKRTAKSSLIKCPNRECKRIFSVPFLRRHLMSFHKESAFDCRVDRCNQRYSTFHQFRSHLMTHSSYEHKIKPYSVQRHKSEHYVCDYEDCGLEFIGLHLYNRHKQTHSERTFFKCQFKGCDYECRTHYQLKDHSERHNSQPIICHTCNKQLVSRRALKEHKDRIHSQTFELFECDFVGCGETFKNKLNLRQHKKRRHPKVIRTFPCNFKGCNKILKNEATMRSHKRIHLAPKFPCTWPECQYKGRTRGALRSHEWVHKPDETRYVCHWPGCEKSVRHKSTLVDHMRSHSNDKRHVCEWPGCQFRTVTHQSLIKHRRTHRTQVKLKKD